MRKANATKIRKSYLRYEFKTLIIEKTA
jgi:hypothetical protein